MASALSAPHFHNEAAAFAYRRGARMAGRPGLPALRRRRAHQQDGRQVHPHGPLQVLPVPQAVHRPHRHHLREPPRSAAYLASGDVSDRRQQEGHQLQPASPHPWRHPQDRLVHVAPHPRSNARQATLPRSAAAAALSRSMRPTSAARPGMAAMPRAVSATRWRSWRWSTATAGRSRVHS